MEQLEAIPGVTMGGSPVHQSRREPIVDMMTVALSQHETAEHEPEVGGRPQPGSSGQQGDQTEEE